MGKKHGLSFSLSRLLGIQTVKQKVARKTGIPTSYNGLCRKLGNAILKGFFK